MEKVENIAKYILSLDKNNDIFINKLIHLHGRDCYEGNVRLNKYLHIMQMVYFAMTDNKLFNEDMYAFDNGVVVNTVMNNYAYLKSNRDSYTISDENVKSYIEKMFNILKYAPLQDLIEISHQDEEWKKKHSFYKKNDQLIDVDSQKENYKIMCADFIDMLNNDWNLIGLSLKIRFNNSGAVASVSHPVLVIGIDKEKNILEVAHIDSITEEKKWKALLKSNVTIRKSNPPETVIDKDSFVQIDNIIQLENFAELENKRRQTDKLSSEKFSKVLQRYNEYKDNEWIDDNKKVFMTKEEIISLNEDLK